MGFWLAVDRVFWLAWIGFLAGVGSGFWLGSGFSADWIVFWLALDRVFWLALDRVFRLALDQVFGWL